MLRFSGRRNFVHEYPDILRQQIPRRHVTLRLWTSMDRLSQPYASSPLTILYSLIGS